MLEKTPKSPLDSKEIKPVILKGNQPWVLIGRTDAEAKTPVFWSSDANSWLIGKVPDAGKNRGQRRRGRQRMRCLDGITSAMDMNLGKLWEMAKDKEGWHATVHGVTKRWTWLGNRTTTTRHIDPKYWLWAVIRGLKLNDLVWRKSQTGSSEELCCVLHLGRCFVWESSLELVHFYMGPKDKWWWRTAHSEARGRLCPPYQALVGLLWPQPTEDNLKCSFSVQSWLLTTFCADRTRVECWLHSALPRNSRNWPSICKGLWGWAFFGIAFLRNWNENWPFPVLWPLLSFPNLLAY